MIILALPSCVPCEVSILFFLSSNETQKGLYIQGNGELNNWSFELNDATLTLVKSRTGNEYHSVFALAFAT